MSEPYEAAAQALFRSQLWQAWCGPEGCNLPIVNEDGVPARQETARVALDAVPDGWAKFDGQWQRIVMHSYRETSGAWLYILVPQDGEASDGVGAEPGFGRGKG